jgi:Na+-translocating ferredoxin:NAD+ oxidoreductase subunit A
METAVGMAFAVVFVLTMAGMITWVVNTFFLNKFGLEYLRTIAFILVIASLVQFVEMFLKKSIPALYAGSGNIFAVDYHQLCGHGCLSDQYQRGIWHLFRP